MVDEHQRGLAELGAPHVALLVDRAQHEFVEFARWSAIPSGQREPDTQKELAEVIGVSEDTLTDWKKRPEFWTLVGLFLREWMREKTPDVIDGLFSKITDGKGGAGDVKFFLALAYGRSPHMD